jgi:NAD(P)-dependent dehydrogenase (short-subunit alcohol dehydrogenase family)
VNVHESTATDFTGVRVLIAGGTSGVGLATASAFVHAGAAHVTVLGRNEDRGAAALDTIKRKSPAATIDFISADVNDPASATDAVERAASAMGRLDVLVNSTVSPYKPTLFVDLKADELITILVSQAAGPMHTCHAAVPIMRRQETGAIVNIASDAARVPTPGETALGGAMAAIVTFSKTLALEVKRYGIRVNTITPSLIINTGSYDRVMEGTSFSKKIFDRIVASAHLGLTEPEDLAGTVLFLSSHSASRITGQVISVNGGISIA